MAGGLSKSRFVAGRQCLKLLWWKVHDRKAPELVPDASQQAIFDRGNAVGDLARSYVPGGELIDTPHYDIPGWLAATQDALARDVSVIYEAAFETDRVFVAVDILERTEAGWVLVEVKSTTSVKPTHYEDVAVQLHVVRGAGLDVVRAELMHLNRECRFPDLSDLFVREDVTAAAERRLGAVPEQIREQFKAIGGDLPEVSTGEHCRQPYRCPFWDRCWPELPPHHISTLYRLGGKQEAELLARGVETVAALPADHPLQGPAARQRQAVQADELVVEPGLGEVLAELQPPLAFLDFESIAPAVPVWPGCRPFKPVAVQLSCHVLDADGSLRHTAWLARGSGDPRGELAAELLAACGYVPLVLAYNAPFERGLILDLADALPELAERLRAVADRLRDLLPMVRDHVYDSGFGGSFSLKAVVASLLPDLAYDQLEIASGQAASFTLEKLLLQAERIPSENLEELRSGLLIYCERDTLALVKLLELLKELAA